MTATSDTASSPAIRSLIPARIDRLPWSRFHTRMVTALGIAWILDGLEITVASNVALACELYEEGEVRACEIGTVMFGLRPDGTEAPTAMDLVRLAVPRRTYTQSHLDYVIEVVTRVADRTDELPGMRIVYQPR